MTQRLGVIDGTVIYAETRVYHIEQALEREAEYLVSLKEGENQ